MVIYISKGNYFDKGTKCFLESDCSTETTKMGVFRGKKTIQGSETECVDVRTYDEFEITEDINLDFKQFMKNIINQIPHDEILTSFEFKSTKYEVATLGINPRFTSETKEIEIWTINLECNQDIWYATINGGNELIRQRVYPRRY